MHHHNDSQNLSLEKGQLLVKLARHTLSEHFSKQIPQEEIDSLNAALRDPCFNSACGTFVTLTIDGKLRGCIGNLTSNESLVSGVRRNAINAAFHDPRFSSLSLSELDLVSIEISILSEPRPLHYRDAADLLKKIRPNIDGVILRKGIASATFLPQVWEQLPQPQDFLTQLCLKAGLAADAWQHSKLEVSTYQVQHFEEHSKKH
ncbi:MAG: AmmeMemoRadiSam system protein A [Phycisphaerae bacterium]|nr:AmmeMemoRadiSam system protein A [Phycisphaerae bacterium]NIS50273.1 AmmeMemoRadiSam system protein A [Phycisphaerae bacterium]